jgi:hypothetical protein
MWMFTLPSFVSNAIGLCMILFFYFLFKKDPDRAMVFIGIYLVWRWLRARKSSDRLIAQQVKKIAASVDRLSKVTYGVERVAEAVRDGKPVDLDDINEVPHADALEYDHLSPDFY